MLVPFLLPHLYYIWGPITHLSICNNPSIVLVPFLLPRFCITYAYYTSVLVCNICRITYGCVPCIKVFPGFLGTILCLNGKQVGPPPLLVLIILPNLQCTSACHQSYRLLGRVSQSTVPTKRQGISPWYKPCTNRNCRGVWHSHSDCQSGVSSHIHHTLYNRQSTGYIFWGCGFLCRLALAI